MSSLEASGPTIVAEGLWKSYRQVEAVRDLSLSVEAGQVLALLGPNGAGKTTTVQMLSTLVPLDAGSASVAGFDVSTQAHQVRQAIGFAGQSAAVDEKLTARENLELFSRLYKLSRTQRKRSTEELIERFELSEFADRIAGTYSGGQRRRLDVAAALVANPPVLFLDEPTTGLDPRSRSELWAAIAELAADGTTILLTTQYLEEADRLADGVLILDHGAEVASGTPESLKHGLREDVLEVHVGDGAEVPGALALLGGIDGVTSDPASGRLRVPLGDDVRRALELLRRLQDGGIPIADFQLRRPTLDDVFLNLTGASATPQELAQ